ncbi:protein FAR1-RELATED SEQUENCE 5-like [Rhizophagus irregularis DAOM 181602=DAOM 197198]|nr:protein FAR1-RELATED SEQUENCE 5-like [Rhizophagus irregularis DAOM 181602=DAOM 197198]
MSDTESISSDNSDNELFTEEFLKNISKDSNSSNNENNENYFNNTSYNTELNSTLRSWTRLCYYEEIVYKNDTKKNKAKPSKTHRSGCKWHVNLFQPIKNNPNGIISVTTLFNEHFGYVLDPLVCRFNADKAFTKSMLKDIEWIVIYKYRNTKDQLGNDVSQLLVHLQWIIFKDWDHETNTLTKIFWMTSNQIECMLNAIGIIPKIFVTDTDSGIDIAIQLKYPSAFHIHCIWHIGQNLPLRFRFKFGELFKPFKRDFYKCRNSLDQEIFKDRYINIFTADIQTTSCYKSVNSAFKQLLFNLNNTLMDIFLAIEERLEKEQNNENYDWTFANDFIENQEIWQITFKRLLENCVQSSIKSIWSVNYLTSVGINYLVILLNNGIYRCLCLSLVTCDISNLKNQLFYPALKFDGLETDFLTDNNSSSIPINSNKQQYVSISKQHLYYSNIQKLIKQANQIACKSCDESFIELLQTYIADKNHKAFELEQSRWDINNQSQTRIHLNLTVDQENDNQIKNLLIRHPKGRPAENARFKGPLETSTKSNIVGSKI